MRIAFLHTDTEDGLICADSNSSIKKMELITAAGDSRYRDDSFA